jgi:hypothetical protein
MTTPPPYPPEGQPNPYYPPPQAPLPPASLSQPPQAPARERRPVTSIIAFVLAAVVFAATMVARLIAAGASGDVPTELLAGLGGLSFISLLLIVPAIALAHLAVTATARPRGARIGRGLAVGALVLAYVDLVMFLVRLIAAAIAPGGYGQPTDFFVNLFYWA